MVNRQDPSSQERPNLSELRELRLYLKTVGDSVRLQVLRHLAQNGETSVSSLAQAVRVSQPLLSWHLGVLKRIDLVNVRREGRLVWYSLNQAVLRSFHRRFGTWIEDGQETHDRPEESEPYV